MRVTRLWTLAAVLFAANASAGVLDQEHASAVRIAVAGATVVSGEDWQAQSLVAGIAAWEPHAVLLTGGYVRRGSPAGWREWRARWSDLEGQIVAIPDETSRRGDKNLARAGELGVVPEVDGLTGSTWGLGTLVSDGVRWRVIVLDTERDALGKAWLDQRTWLPRAVAGEYDKLLVVTGRPLASLQDPATEGYQWVDDLLQVVREHAPAGKLMAVISGGTRTNEVLLHSGSFGEVHLVAGNAGVSAADLGRRGTSPLERVGEMALVDGFDAMLRQEWRRRHGSFPDDAYPGEALPIRGWWQVVIDGRDLSLAFQMDDGAGARNEAYRIRYNPAVGWVAD